jgi:hypothetical protein
MVIGITIFGAARRGGDAALCYGFIRPVRGPGEYPAPALPGDIPLHGIRRIPIEGYEAELITWDKIFDGAAAEAADAELKNGRFTIPAGCPIEGGKVIPGSAFGPILIMEAYERIRASGAGILHLMGIARNDGVEHVRQKLDEAVTPAIASAVLAQLIEMIAVQSGLGAFFKGRRRIGVIDRFSRAQVAAGKDGPLFVVRPEKLDSRSREPMRRVWICREAAVSDRPFRIHVILKNFDEVLSDLLLDISPGQSELFVEANGHITDVTLYAFDSDGRIADHLRGTFAQQFNFEIAAHGRSDALPPVFAGAPQSADLKKRPRIHTTRFKGPAAGDRSGGLDVVRRQRDHVGKLIGGSDGSRENVWFERGAEGQIDVIRWIKAKIERPGTTSAYLIDPYLGSDALKRVIARQGHENVDLTIVVSPGRIDPDADEVDTKATADHLAKLVATADEWAERLCGQISIIHIRRGEGAKQAFHDRYVSIVDQQGVPTVYLLSNSLNKAAGDWPFAISELDRIMSWRVHGYIQAVIEGKQGELDLHPELLWRSVEPANPAVSPSPTDTANPSNDGRPEWMKAASAFLADLWNVVIRNTQYEQAIGQRVDAFLKTWPSGVDATLLANKLFETVGHRDEVVVFISALFAAGTAEQAEVARVLDDLLLDRFLAGLPQNDRPATRYFIASDRNALTQHIGRAIARKDVPTNFVRARLNPIVHELVQIIESQRFEVNLAFEAFETGVFLTSVGLEVAIMSAKVNKQFRTGMATDYIHWLGRLTRSDIAECRFDKRLGLPDDGFTDLKFAVAQVLSARKALGEKLDEAICSVLDDPLMLPLVKELLGDSAS